MAVELCSQSWKCRRCRKRRGEKVKVEGLCDFLFLLLVYSVLTFEVILYLFYLEVRLLLKAYLDIRYFFEHWPSLA